MTTKIYEYGLRAPTVGLPIVEAQMRLAHDYYNRLVELERQRREENELAFLAYPEYAQAAAAHRAAEQVIEALLVELRKAKQAVRGPAGVPAGLPAARLAEKVTRLARNAARRTALLVPSVAVAVDSLNAADAHRRREARAASGLYWGTYLVVEQSSEAMRKTARGVPRFRRWDGRGHLAVQIQNGMSVEDLFAGTDTRLQISPVPADTWDSRARRRQAQITTARMRVASVGRAPIWAEACLYLHRPLPADARVKWAHLLRERLADRDRWTLQLSVETETDTAASAGDGALAVDLGWRVRPDGVRVGYCADAGGHWELALTAVQIAALTKAESLRSIRDRNLDDLKTALREWRAAAPALPNWISEVAAAWHVWRSQRRFAALARQWGEQRFPGDALVFAVLSAWAQQDRHLWQWECNQRDKALRRRREQYRIWAAELASRYERLVIEGDASGRPSAMDLRPLAARPLDEEEEDSILTASRRWRQLIAPSELRTCLVQAFVARRRRVVYIPAPGTTAVCHVCGEDYPRGAPLVQICVCGAVWDQDHNAAVNLLARGGAADGSPSPLAVSKAPGGRWKRRKTERAEKSVVAAAVDHSQLAAKRPKCAGRETCQLAMPSSRAQRRDLWAPHATVDGKPARNAQLEGTTSRLPSVALPSAPLPALAMPSSGAWNRARGLGTETSPTQWNREEPSGTERSTMIDSGLLYPQERDRLHEWVSRLATYARRFRLAPHQPDVAAAGGDCYVGARQLAQHLLDTRVWRPEAPAGENAALQLQADLSRKGEAQTWMCEGWEWHWRRQIDLGGVALAGAERVRCLVVASLPPGRLFVEWGWPEEDDRG